MKKLSKIYPPLLAMPLLMALAGRAQAEQFVSLNLCADRLLIELATEKQIGAMSIYSDKPLMMLEKINKDKPKVDAKLDQLLPFLDKTILLNEMFYPQLSAQLKQLGVKVVAISDPQTPEQLFELIQQLGDLTGNKQRAQQLISQLQATDFKLKQRLSHTLILSDTGALDGGQNPYAYLLQLVGLRAINISGDIDGDGRAFSMEKVIKSQPNQLIIFSDQQGYNQQQQWLNHPALAKLFAKIPRFRLPLKYSYCFDQGIWQGAEMIFQQAKKGNAN